MGSYSLRKDCDIWWKLFHRRLWSFVSLLLLCVHVCMVLIVFCVCLPINGVKAVSCKWLFHLSTPQTHSHTYIVSLSKAVNVNWTRLLRYFILHLHFYPLRTVCVFAHEVSDNLFFALLLMWSYLFLTHWHSSCLFSPPILLSYADSRVRMHCNFSICKARTFWTTQHCFWQTITNSDYC